MNNVDSSLETPPPDSDHGEKHSVLFTQLVMQQTNLALMLLGKLANPTTGETTRDVEAAQFFIDQLEMLEVKTRGNLTPPEASLLKQCLLNLRMAFVEALEAPDTEKQAAAGSEKSAPAQAEADSTGKTAEQSAGAQTKEEPSSRKFFKKY